ncbi:hypothetical protein GX51_01541 [Blastomyces parvus]|uniref:DUF3176 domain containing protein n=1 Tax=Blastomyces parvus TaxID=2060905 RepID=A0A2B7XGD2_9EURO|nr:hypothetical protein GX51_01541 [Blastomyces parvus]
MSHSYQSLHKPSPEVGGNWDKGPNASSEEISDHATTHHDQSSRNWYSRFVIDWWLWEIGACVTSLLALGTTVALLAVYSGKPEPELPKYITLNAIISILTNVVKLSLTAAVTAAISQLKWVWLKDMRPLQDLQIFDDASRGLEGSLYILFHLRGRHLVCLGALITIVAMALEPFMQQLVVYPVGLVYREDGNALVLRTDNVTYLAQGMLLIYYQAGSMDFGVTRGIMNALYNRDSAPELEPFCPTGNCTWPVFHSIGVCSRCVDMADKVKMEGACTPGDLLMAKNCTISLQHGIPIVNPYEGAGVAASHIAWLLNYIPHGDYLTAAGSPQIDGNFAGIHNPLIALGWLEIDYSSLTNTTPIARAMECMFTYCLERYNVSVKAGVSTIKTEPVHLASMDQQSGWNVTAPLLPEKDKEKITTFVVDDNAGHSVWKNLILELVGNASTWDVSTEYFVPSNTFVSVAGTIETDAKVHLLETIARSITYTLLQPSNQTVAGLTGIPRPFVEVRWAWVILPAIVVFTTILFLCLAMLWSKRHNVPVWKSSYLALLYHGLEPPVDDKSRFTRMSDLSNHAANVRVRLATSTGDNYELQEGGGEVVDGTR